MEVEDYSIIYTSLLTIGILLLDNENLRKFKGIKYLLIKLLLIFILTLPMFMLVMIDNYIEKTYTIYKFINHYGLDYDDKLDFIYHIRTNKKNNRKSTCKIKGKYENNNLKIIDLKDCDNDEDVKESYLKLITSTGKFDDNKPININSEIKNFTWK